jgi:hypothetical protein
VLFDGGDLFRRHNGASSAQARVSGRARSAAATANKQRSLTTFSQTERTAPDSGGLPGHAVDPDLRIRILAHWLDGWH